MIYEQYMYNYPHKKAYRALEGRNIHSIKAELEADYLGLYVHIPFCRSRCGYCNLFSLGGRNQSMMGQYVDKLQREAQALSKLADLKINEFIIGGGTPLYLSNEDLERVLAIPNKFFNKDLEDIFVGIETSPMDTVEDKLKILKDNKVDRLSMGVQSFVDKELVSLNRSHRLEDVERSLNAISKYDFESLNLDLIYGIENQTIDSFLYSLNNLISYSPDEVFLYPLYIRDNKNLKASPIDRYEFYTVGRNFLLENGYVQNSMRSFSLKAKRLSTCGFDNSIALGAGGRSYIGNLHYSNHYSDKQGTIRDLISSYIDSEDLGQLDYGIELDEDELKRLYLIKNLFVVEGLTISDYENRFNSRLFEDFGLLETWLVNGYFALEEDHLYPTDLGISLSDYLGPNLISRQVKDKMDKWIDGNEF